MENVTDNPLKKQLSCGQYNGYAVKEIKRIPGPYSLHNITYIYQVGNEEKWFIIVQNDKVIADFITSDLRV